eukprot:g2633.t1
MIPVNLMFQESATPSVIRVFRVARFFRIFRMVKGVRQLNNLFDTLVLSIPSLWNIGIFIFLAFFVFAICAVEFFGNVMFTPGGLTKYSNFRHFPSAMLTLFRISTGDDWTRVSTGCDLRAPTPCGGDTCEDGQFCSCGYVWAPWFFIVFSIVSGIVLLNLFVAVILDNFGESSETIAKNMFFQTANLWAREWQHFDLAASGEIHWRSFYTILENTPAPWGFGELNCRESDRLRFAKALRIPLVSSTDTTDSSTASAKKKSKSATLPSRRRKSSPSAKKRRSRGTSIGQVRNFALDIGIEMGEISSKLDSSDLNDDVVVSQMNNESSFRRKKWMVPFHAALLAMVKFVGFAKTAVNLNREQKEASSYDGHSGLAAKDALCLHHAMAVDLIEEWWFALRSGYEVKELARKRAMRNFKINHQRSSQGHKSQFRKELSRIKKASK